MIFSRNLCFSYSAGDEAETPAPPALDGININIDKGEFIAVMGHNGSGKSTLARHLNALLTPSSGTLWVNGMDTSVPDNTWPVRQNVGMVFQNPDNQLIATVVEEDVAFGPENLGVAPREIRGRVDNALAAVRMSEYASYAPHYLSGGQKQRVAVAGVLAMRPECIVLDESTAMLDPVGRREVLDTVTRLNRDAGITIILITHFMEEAALAKRVLVMNEGAVIMDGAPREVFADPARMKSVGLDVPQMTALAAALRRRGIPMEGTPLTVEEFLNEPYIRALISRGKGKPSAALPAFEDEPPSAPALMKIDSLTYIYNQGAAFERKALDNFSAEIRAGECVGIIGHTGSGKSTLVQHMNALLKPTSGSVTLDGHDIYADKRRLKKVRERVGLVFQYPEHQLFDETVYKDVSFGPSNMGLTRDETDRRTREALALVGLKEDTYEKSPFALSGGQKRRAAIAGVLAMQPDILVLDEPAAGLDPAGREEILNHIQRTRDTLNNTVVLVSHNMEDVARLADRVLILSGGRLICSGTPARVFSQADVLEANGLAVPQIYMLAARLREKGLNIPENVFTPEAAADALASL